MSAVDEETKRQIVAEILEERARRPKFLAKMKQRQQQGWKIACTCKWILKQEFRASRVILFGSLLDHEQMTWHSDIDLAVWGLPEKDFFKAGAALDSVASYYGSEFEVDLVEIQNAKLHIRKAIETEGRELEPGEDEKMTLSQIRQANDRRIVARVLAAQSNRELGGEKNLDCQET